MIIEILFTPETNIILIQFFYTRFYYFWNCLVFNSLFFQVTDISSPMFKQICQIPINIFFQIIKHIRQLSVPFKFSPQIYPSWCLCLTSLISVVDQALDMILLDFPVFWLEVILFFSLLPFLVKVCSPDNFHKREYMNNAFLKSICMPENAIFYVYT